MKILRLIIIFLFFHEVAESKNWYVSSQRGRAGNSGVTSRSPKANLQEVANLTRPGDTVFVMGGSYTNDCPSCNALEITRSGKEGKEIVYTNFPGTKPVIKFSGWAGIAVQNGASYIKLNGFEVVGNNSKVSLRSALRQPRGCRNRSGDYDPIYNGNGIVISGKDGNSHHITVSNMVVHDCGGGGISAARADYITFEDNLVYNTSWYTTFGTSGISFYQFWNYDTKPGYHNYIRRNKSFNNRNYVPWFQVCRIADGNGIIVDDFRNLQNGSQLGVYKGKTLIENNICWYNGGTGIHTFQSDNVDIINNVAYCNSQSRELDSGQILASISSNIIIANNILVSDGTNKINSNYSNQDIIYSNNLHYNRSNPSLTSANLFNFTCVNGLDPRFISPRKSLKADFRLRADSPAINRGSFTYKSNTDLSNNVRPRGKGFDMGVYEF